MSSDQHSEIRNHTPPASIYAKFTLCDPAYLYMGELKVWLTAILESDEGQQLHCHYSWILHCIISLLNGAMRKTERRLVRLETRLANWRRNQVRLPIRD